MSQKKELTWKGQKVIIKDDGTWWLSNRPAPRNALTRNEAEDNLIKDKGFKNTHGRLVLLTMLGSMQYVREASADYEYQTWLSQKAIADLTGLDRNTVRKYVNALVEDGYLVPSNERVKNYKPVQAYWFCSGVATPRQTTKEIGDNTSSGRGQGNSANLKRTVPKAKADANFHEITNGGYTSADSVHKGSADSVHKGCADSVHKGCADSVRINNKTQYPDTNIKMEQTESSVSAGASPSGGLEKTTSKGSNSHNEASSLNSVEDMAAGLTEQQSDTFADSVRIGTDEDIQRSGIRTESDDDWLSPKKPALSPDDFKRLAHEAAESLRVQREKREAQEREYVMDQPKYAEEDDWL